MTVNDRIVLAGILSIGLGAMFLSVIFHVGDAADKPTSYQISNIQSVYMHEHDRYTVSYAKEKELIMKPFTGQFKIYMDVPNNKPMWAFVTEHTRGYFTHNVDIHIHDVNDINTAGWSRRYSKLPDEYGTTIRVDK